MIGIDRFFGIVAGVSDRLRRITVHGLPLNIGGLIVLTFSALFAWAIAEVDDSDTAWLILILSVVCHLLLLQSLLRHDIVFRARPDLSPEPPWLGDLPLEGTPLMVKRLFASGRFWVRETNRTRLARVLERLMYGSRQDRWFLLMPAVLFILDRHEFSLRTHYDRSLHLLGRRMENRPSEWTIEGRFETLDRPRVGDLFFRLRVLPAVRLQFQNAVGRPRTVILCFENGEARRHFLSMLERMAGNYWPGIY